MNSTKSAVKEKKAITPERLKLAKLLLKHRKEKGYDTAYGFFHKSGGEKHFGFSYHHYLLIEKGTRLPSQDSFKVILDTLGSRRSFPDGWDEIVKAYVQAVFEGDPFFDVVFEGRREKVAQQEESVDAMLLKKTARKRVVDVPRMTGEQAAAAVSSTENFWVYQWLYQTGQRRTAAELAQALRMPEARIRAAAEALLACKLIDMSKDKYFSPFFSTGLFSPTSFTKEQMLWFFSQISRMIAQSGEKPLYPRYMIAVEDKDHLDSICAMAREFMNKVFLFRPTSPVSHGTLVAVEARVSPLLPIGD